jgi:hypothetical protein
MGTFLPNKVKIALSSLFAILTIHVAKRREVGVGHWLHSYGRIQKRKIVAHIFHAPHTKRARVALASSVFSKARKMHDVTTLQSSQRFCGLKEHFVTNGTRPLKFLRDASMFLIRKRYASVAPHTMSKIDPKTLSHPTNVTIGAMILGLGTIVVQVANSAKILGKGLTIRFASGVDASVFGRLKCVAFHAHDFRHGVSIKWFFLIRTRHFAVLFATKTTSVKASRNRMSKFAYTDNIVRFCKQNAPRRQTLISNHHQEKRETTCTRVRSHYLHARA